MKTIFYLCLVMELCFGMVLSLQLVMDLWSPTPGPVPGAPGGDGLLLPLGIAALVATVVLAWWASRHWSGDSTPLQPQPISSGGRQPASGDLPTSLGRTALGRRAHLR